MAFSSEVVARGEEAGRLGMDAGSWGMEPVRCFQARRVGVVALYPPEVAMLETSMGGVLAMEMEVAS